LLSAAGSVRVVGHAQSLQETLSLAQEASTDAILLIDPVGCLASPGGKEFRRIEPRFKVLAIVGPSDIAHLRSLLLSGISGLLGKDCSLTELIEALRTVSEGQVVIDPAFVERLLSAPAQCDGWERLTPREKQVVSLLRAGFSNKEIARRLLLSVRTVEMHLYNSYSKLNVHSRLEAAFRA